MAFISCSLATRGQCQLRLKCAPATCHKEPTHQRLFGWIVTRPLAGKDWRGVSRFSLVAVCNSKWCSKLMRTTITNTINTIWVRARHSRSPPTTVPRTAWSWIWLFVGPHEKFLPLLYISFSVSFVDDYFFFLLLLLFAFCFFSVRYSFPREIVTKIVGDKANNYNLFVPCDMLWHI